MWTTTARLLIIVASQTASLATVLFWFKQQQQLLQLRIANRNWLPATKIFSLPNEVSQQQRQLHGKTIHRSTDLTGGSST